MRDLTAAGKVVHRGAIDAEKRGDLVGVHDVALRRRRRRYRRLPDATGPHEVVVEFSAEKAHLVSSREWHPSQTVTALKNGRVRITFAAPNLAPIVSWILEWGPHARAIAPAALVEEVMRELEEARAQYAP